MKHLIVAMFAVLLPLAAQTSKRSATPAVKAGPFKRLADGKPDMQGIWNAPGSPAWDVEDHAVAVYGIPPGPGIVVDPPDGKIPYQPWALEKKKDLFAHHMFQDPEAHCFLSGVPRQVYAPFGFEILQPAGYVVEMFENFHAYRAIPLDGRPHISPSIKLIEGDSRGHWEGDTLVIDVTNQVGWTWFDMAGNFHSEDLHVVERMTPVDANTIKYEATIEDPKVYTRPWKMRFNLSREQRRGFELLEFACPEGEQDLKHYTSSEGK